MSGAGGCQDVNKTRSIGSYMPRNFIIPYDPALKKKARKLRINCTPSETLLWSKIRRKSLGYEFHRQVPIYKYIVDFYCHELSLAIEIDGSIHNNRHEYDIVRQRNIERFGVKFIRFDNEDIISDVGGVIRTLIATISEIEKMENR